MIFLQETDDKEDEVSAPQIFAQTQDRQDSVLAVDKADEQDENNKEEDEKSNPEQDQDPEMMEPDDNRQNKANKVQ